MQSLLEYEKTSKNHCPQDPDDINSLEAALHWALRRIAGVMKNDEHEQDVSMFHKASEMLKLTGFAAFLKNDAPVDYSVEHRSGEFKSLAEIFHKNGNVVDGEDGKRLQRHDESADEKIFRRDVAAGPQEVINAVHKEI